MIHPGNKILTKLALDSLIGDTGTGRSRRHVMAIRTDALDLAICQESQCFLSATELLKKARVDLNQETIFTQMLQDAAALHGQISLNVRHNNGQPVYVGHFNDLANRMIGPF